MDDRDEVPANSPANIEELDRFLRRKLGTLEGVVDVHREGNALILSFKIDAMNKHDAHLQVEGETLSIRGASGDWTISTQAFKSIVTHTNDSLVMRYVERASRNPRKQVFVRRAMNAVHDICEAATPGTLENAASAPSDLGVLLEALESPESVVYGKSDSPLEQAKLRGVQARRTLLAQAGQPYTVQEVASRLGLTRQAVDKRRRAGQLLAVALGRRGYVYPSRQFTDQGTIPGLAEVLRNLRDLDAWMKLAFFVNPNSRLNDRSPFDGLEAGETATANQAALAYAEHGAA